MNLDELTVEIRPRRAWEAVDLGLLMARRWWWPMTKVWLILTLPLFLLLNFLPDNWLWLSYALLWWLKPLFERPLLLILSQAVFNQAPNTRATIKVFPALALRQIISSLTWRRLSPSRSMDLPVLQLEGLSGVRRSERLNVLHREDSAPSSWLSITGFFIEIFMALGLLALLYILIPDEVSIDQVQFFSADEALWHILFTCYCLAQTGVAPFYTACGFSLYLNRRIKLEAWDIDIAFQRIVNKRSTASVSTTAALLLIISLIIGLGQIPTSRAEIVSDSQPTTEMPAPYQRDSAKAAIQEVIASEDFHQKKTIRYPGFSFGDENKKQSENENGFWEWFFGLFKSAEKMASIATGMELLLWALILCLIFLVVFRYRHWLAAYLPQNAPHLASRSIPNTLFGLDLTRESLPANVGASALALWRSGEQRAALALLYRASLSRLLERGLNIEDGHTETECLEVAQAFSRGREHTRPAVAYFAQLTQAWRRLAYGHIAPDEKDAEQLCQQWNSIWDVTEPAPPRTGAGRD